MFSRDIFSVRGLSDFNGYLSKMNAAAMLRRPMGTMFLLILFIIKFMWTSAISFVSGFRIFVSFWYVLLRHNDPFKHDIQKHYKADKRLYRQPNIYIRRPPNEFETYCDKVSSQRCFDFPTRRASVIHEHVPKK
jgi:hypothetical protein